MPSVHQTPVSTAGAAAAHDQKMAQEHLESQDAQNAANAASAEAARRMDSATENERVHKRFKMPNDNENDDIASQALIDDDEQEWEKDDATQAYAAKGKKEPAPTLADMKYPLKHSRICVRIHQETKGHVFSFVSTSMGKPIILFAHGMGELLNNVLPEAHSVYDAMLKEINELTEGAVVYSRTIVVSKYIKNVIEISFFRGKLYIFLKRLGKPDAFSSDAEPYTGPVITPDEDGFVPTKGGSFTLDRYEHNPDKILDWAMTCRSMPY